MHTAARRVFTNYLFLTPRLSSPSFPLAPHLKPLSLFGRFVLCSLGLNLILRVCKVKAVIALQGVATVRPLSPPVQCQSHLNWWKIQGKFLFEGFIQLEVTLVLAASQKTILFLKPIFITLFMTLFVSPLIFYTV